MTHPNIIAQRSLRGRFTTDEVEVLIVGIRACQAGRYRNRQHFLEHNRGDLNDLYSTDVGCLVETLDMLTDLQTMMLDYTLKMIFALFEGGFPSEGLARLLWFCDETLPEPQETGIVFAHDRSTDEWFTLPAGDPVPGSFVRN